MRQVCRAGGLVLLLTLAVGCRAGKLSEEKSFTLPDAGSETKIYELPAQRADQTIKVEVTSDKPVDVFVFSAANAPDLDGLPTDEWKEKAITHKGGVTGGTLTAKIPAKQETRIVITLAAKTDKAAVKVKMTN